MNVAVLGCGPMGLICASRLDLAGHTVRVYSHKEKSIIPGAMHLHGPIPGLTPVYPEGTIQFVRMGTAAGYAKKVYGDPARETGWGNYFQVYPSWKVPPLYDNLYRIWESSIVDLDITRGVLPEIVKEYDEVISTIPQWSICDMPDVHQFNGQPYWIKTLPTPPQDESTEIFVYNGLPDD